MMHSRQNFQAHAHNIKVPLNDFNCVNSAGQATENTHEIAEWSQQGRNRYDGPVHVVDGRCG